MDNTKLIKYIVVDDEASSTITQIHHLQSAEFTQGCSLASALKNGLCDKITIPSIYCGLHEDGMYFLSQKSEGHYLVFDLEKANIFSNRLDTEILIIFQRTLRLAMKIWNNYD